MFEMQIQVHATGLKAAFLLGFATIGIVLVAGMLLVGIIEGIERIIDCCKK